MEAKHVWTGPGTQNLCGVMSPCHRQPRQEREEEDEGRELRSPKAPTLSLVACFPSCLLASLGDKGVFVGTSLAGVAGRQQGYVQRYDMARVGGIYGMVISKGKQI